VKFARNILAVIGLAALIASGVLSVKALPYLSRFEDFDKRAFSVYWEMFEKLLETGNAADASVWKARVRDGITFEELEETIRFVANQHNVKNVGELDVYKSIEAATGKPHRIIKVYMFCDPLTGARLVTHSDAYSAYFPCRLSVIEDETGKFWLYTLNIDAMIYGGEPLPPLVRREAEKIKAVMLDILKRGAEGNF